MNNKRKAPSAIFHNPSESKRRRQSALDDDDDEGNGTKAAQPKVDQTYGQRGAFPGLDEGEDEPLFYGPASDGLEYLRMVRSEAKSVPTLLVAPSPYHDEDHKNDHQSASYEQGYYADGAYTAAPIPPTYHSTPSTSSDHDPDPQEAYHASLCSRFASHSATLQHPPPNLVPSSSTANLAQALNSNSHYRWRGILNNTKPSMLLLGNLSQEAVLQGLSIIEGKLSEENLRGNENLGLWIWGLLGRCRDVGEMGSEEVGILRDLGKKAIWVLRGVQAGFANADEVDVDSEGSEDEEVETGMDTEQGAGLGNGSYSAKDTTAGAEAPDQMKNELALSHGSNTDESLEAVKARMLASLPPESLETNPNNKDDPIGIQSPSSPNLHAGQFASSEKTPPPALNGIDEQATKLQATLDMIITIVGEFYGQRDLLSGRLSWDEC